jgi:hypothetical protein
MDLLESDAQSFIVKVWVEEGSETGSQAVLRGHITHVSSHERRYLKNLGEIEDFTAHFLEEMGVKLGVRWRIRRWLKRLMARS